MAKKNGALRLYKSYMFRDKDPIIDAFRTLRSEAHLSYAAVERISNVKAATMRRWERGATKRPQFCTVVAAGRGAGATGITFRGGVKFITKIT